MENFQVSRKPPFALNNGDRGVGDELKGAANKKEAGRPPGLFQQIVRKARSTQE
jgi:hypothetical protein